MKTRTDFSVVTTYLTRTRLSYHEAWIEALALPLGAWTPGAQG